MIYVCPVCSKEFNLFRSLRGHVTQMHPSYCYICRKQFKSSDSLKLHVLRCSLLDNFRTDSREHRAFYGLIVRTYGASEYRFWRNYCKDFAEIYYCRGNGVRL